MSTEKNTGSFSIEVGAADLAAVLNEVVAMGRGRVRERNATIHRLVQESMYHAARAWLETPSIHASDPQLTSALRKWTNEVLERNASAYRF